MGRTGILYCLGAAVVLPFLFELTFQNPSRAKVAEFVAAVACIAGLASMMMLAWIRGDILAQQLSSVPSVVIDDAEPAPPSRALPDFYQDTIKMMRLALMLLAFAMEIGAGLALHQARKTQSEDAEDWGKLRARLAEIQKRLLAITYEVLKLESEGPRFKAAFWADFYEAMLTHTVRSAIGKFLLSGIILLAFFPHQSFAATGPTIVIAVDLSKSEGVKDATGNTEFKKNIEAVTRVLANAAQGSQIRIVAITDHSFTQPYILLSAKIPEERGYFGERLRGARAELVRVWKSRTAHLMPSFPGTDLIGALFLASDIFQRDASASDKLLLIFSDMENSTPELDLEHASGTDALLLFGNALIPNLKGVDVQISGVDAAHKSIAYWQNVKNFWTKYLSRAGAKVRSYTALRELKNDELPPRCSLSARQTSRLNSDHCCSLSALVLHRPSS
jgi:hypothetical protein